MDNPKLHTTALPYKFKELKVYSSTEWLADNKKKYRQVFDKDKTAFIYAELALYNKEFDKESWDVEVQLKCFELTNAKRLVCSLDLKKKVSKYDNIIYIREGWGNKRPGTLWNKGTYYWEAWIEDVKIGTKYFYIEEVEDLEQFEPDVAEYMELKSVRLYEGKYDDVNPDDRNYYNTFSFGETRYIYAEIEAANLNIYENWQCEVFVKFFNESRELKGQVVRLFQVKENDEKIIITAGWGANVKGSWRIGNYTVEIVFMDQLLGIVPFTIGTEFVEGDGPLYINEGNFIQAVPQGMQASDEALSEIMMELNQLVGLDAIKQQVRDHADYLEFVKLRKRKGFKEENDLEIHSLYTGNPGTGKTTIAKMMGKIYKSMGLLSKGHVHEVDRVSLVGEYIGHTAPKVKEAIEQARGGILFVDEAYALARANDDTKDFGREVIEILMKEMSDGPGDLAVIVAGYPAEMEYFLNSNPGLKSRFKIHYQFDDYLPRELSKIAEFAMKEMQLQLTEEAKFLLDKTITHAYRNRDKSFGNARYVYDLIQKAKLNLGLRIMKDEGFNEMENDMLSTLITDDVKKLNVKKEMRLPGIPVDQDLLHDCLSELDSLVGLTSVKKEIHELVELTLYYQEKGINPLLKISLHTVFVGNPGTGKTTVARIIANIYRALGILERGHMVETDRMGLVAGYVGQTAMKTARKIDEALGGILFIDEAYALAQSSSKTHGDFGQEAIQTLLKRMEDDRAKFFVIAAGYPENMKEFLNSNPGLKSRFDKVIRFEDYQSSELTEIAEYMLAAEQVHMSPKAKQRFEEGMQMKFGKRDKYFGNAREVRKWVENLLYIQRLRLASEFKKGKDHNPKLISVEDVNLLIETPNQQIFERRKIGY